MNPSSINPSDIGKSYRGKSGCMCGCRGTYTSHPGTCAKRLYEMVVHGYNVTIGVDLGGHPWVSADIPGCRTVTLYSSATVAP